MHVGLPRDPAQWLALGLAAAALVAPPRWLEPRRRSWLVVGMLAAFAALLSWAYIDSYLHGGPRIIDATSYFLEARLFAHGHFTFAASEPAAATMGRFLVRSEADSARVGVIFPPGYPAVLSLGQWVGAPLVVGPVIAALLVVATFELAKRVFQRNGEASAPFVPALAASFSVVCAALRYHTADTMSHGLAALCFTGALALGFRARDHFVAEARLEAVSLAAGAGLCAGWLAATRPASALALGAVLVFAVVRRKAGSPLVASAIFGALPGLALLAIEQYAVTGTWFESTQRLYYALSDGPPGCFRYGFGSGIGCIGEHGDYVRAELERGYGLREAISTTLRRLGEHGVDALNAEPLALLVALGAWASRKNPRARLVTAAVIAQIAAYVPFYFDGSYPGGGARFFADILPLEHVLAALGVLAVVQWPHAARPGEARDRAIAFCKSRAPSIALGLALVGFTFRAGFEHAELRDREGGRPMFDEEVVARAGITKGIIFVGTDHGFNLGFDPENETLRVVRRRGDDVDRLAWEAAGRPPAFAYAYDVTTGAAQIAPMAFDTGDAASVHIEGETLWPPLEQHHAFALVEHDANPCVSQGRFLAVHRAEETPPINAAAAVVLELPTSGIAGRRVLPRIVRSAGDGFVDLVVDGVRLGHWSVGEASALALASDPAHCVNIGPPVLVPSVARRAILVIEPVTSGSIAFDRLVGATETR